MSKFEKLLANPDYVGVLDVEIAPDTARKIVDSIASISAKSQDYPLNCRDPREKGFDLGVACLADLAGRRECVDKQPVSVRRPFVFNSDDRYGDLAAFRVAVEELASYVGVAALPEVFDRRDDRRVYAVQRDVGRLARVAWHRDISGLAIPSSAEHLFEPDVEVVAISVYKTLSAAEIRALNPEVDRA